MGNRGEKEASKPVGGACQQHGGHVEAGQGKRQGHEYGQHTEEGRDSAADVRLPLPRDGRGDQRERGEVLQHGALVAQVTDHGIREVHPLAAHVAADLHQPFRLRDPRNRFEQNAVGDAEDRGVGGDADGQTQDGGEREARPLSQRAGRVAQIVGQSFHGRYSLSAVIGSTAEARRAGTYPANTATTRSTAPAPTNVAGSVGST